MYAKNSQLFLIGQFIEETNKLEFNEYHVMDKEDTSQKIIKDNPSQNKHTRIDQK